MTAATGNAFDYFVDRHLREGRGERLAFVDPWRSLTYAELGAAAARFAAGLAAAGIERERRIALLMLDTIDFPVAFWGTLRAGIVPVPINTLLPADITRYILEDSRAAAVVISAPLVEPLRPVLDRLKGLHQVVVSAPDGSALTADPRSVGFAAFLDSAAPAAGEPVLCSPDEVAFWLYSSGSTGAPKGARHVHSSLRATADTYGREVLQLVPDDLRFTVAKLFFAYGLGNSMTFPMAVGAAAVLYPDRPTPDAVLTTMRHYRPTIFAGVPTLYAALLAHPELGPGAGSDRLRRSISAGEPLPEHVGRRWRETVGTDILDGLGSTEMLHIFISNRAGEVKYGTTGKPVPGYEVRLVDDNGDVAARGEMGELQVRGPTSAVMYWNNREQSAATFLGEWTRSGDKYVEDEQGYFVYCGRRDDMLKVGGIYVSPFEVEGVLQSHPDVLEAAVVGWPDDDKLIKPKAFVVLKSPDKAGDALKLALQDYCREKLAPYKYPRWLDFRGELPKTATGKIQRFKLRAEAEGR
jgi:benzoate-CoA ligase family protein